MVFFVERHPVTPYIQNFFANDQGFSDFSLKKVVLPDPTKHLSNGVIARQVAFGPLFSEKISKFFRLRPAQIEKSFDFAFLPSRTYAKNRETFHLFQGIFLLRIFVRFLKTLSDFSVFLKKSQV